MASRRQGALVNVFAVMAAACTPVESRPKENPAPPPTDVQPPPSPRQASARSFKFADRPRATSHAEENPISLTASDGTGLKLVSLRARAFVDDPLALTELRLTFENPEARVLEGQFRIALPSGASISRFAMKIDGRWQEGEVVERQAARRAYEDFLHRKQDPALLEQAAGNEFSARVFPIPARGTKELILTYSEELAAGPYRLPLRGLPELGELDIEIQRRGGPTLREEKRGFVPDRDFVVEATRGAGLRSGDLVVARVVPVAADSEPEEIDSLLVLFDTSASRALGFRDGIAVLGDLVTGLREGAARDAPLAVAAFDQDVELIFEGTPGGFDGAPLARLQERAALGASDPARALRWAAERGWRRVLIIGDGVATAGGELPALASLERIDAIVVGGIRDEAALRRIVAAGKRPGALIDGHLEPPEIAARLVRAARAGVEISVEGAEWWYPRTVSGVQAGDAVLVFASLPEGKRFDVRVDGRAYPIDEAALGDAEPALLERGAARAHIAALIERKETAKGGEAEALRQQIIQLSMRKRVLSPYTALLVLETEADYARFGIDRRALADILTVGEHGIGTVDRLAAVPRGGKRTARPVEREAEDGERANAPRDESKDEKRKVAAGEGQMEMNTGSSAMIVSKPAEGMVMADAPKTVEKEEDAPASPPPPPSPTPEAVMAEPMPAPARRPDPEADRPRRSLANDNDDEDGRPRLPPHTGPFREVTSLLARRRHEAALARARAWRAESPGDVLALVALGEALEATGDAATAARAYGSLIDLFPDRADLRRFAGERLEHIDSAAARELAVDTYRRAVLSRPDHPSSHRLFAYALLRAGRPEEAFDALAAGLTRDYPDGRFAGAREVLAEDLGLIAAAWTRAEPSRGKEIRSKLRAAGGTVENGASLRFVLVWETDANDVDFHIHDANGDHAYYQRPELSSGGRLYADVTTGYGPECFTIRGPRARRVHPYTLQAHYYSRGPMGYGMGKLEIIEHDGKGGLKFEQRPFVVMQDGAFVELGKVR